MLPADGRLVQMMNDPHTNGTLYERVGGHSFFAGLVESFYAAVAGDPVLRPIYPEDLEPGKARLAAFLAQYWGGPPHYSMERGHPRLRMRHARFPIGQAERDAWVSHMIAAVRATEVSSTDASLLIGYFEHTSTFLMNKT